MPPKATAKTAAAKPSPAKKSSPAKKVAVPSPGKSKRQPSAYQNFMKTELAKVKKENPTLPHREAFTKAAHNWANSSLNPKNK